MSVARSSPVPGWWSRTWPLVVLGLLSVAMWAGRIRNVLTSDSLGGVGQTFRLLLAGLFIVLGSSLLISCWVGQQHRNWRRAAYHTEKGWRVGAGVPEWGYQLAMWLVVFTVVVWLIQGVGILVDPGHDVQFKAVHTFLMVGSLIVAGTAWWGLRRTWPVSSSSEFSMPG